MSTSEVFLVALQPGDDPIATLSPGERLLCPTLVRHAQVLCDPPAYARLPEAVKLDISREWIELVAQRNRSERCQNCEQTLVPAEVKRCARCKYVYCGARCQEKHWPVHKAICKSIASQEKTLSLVRNLASGEERQIDLVERLFEFAKSSMPELQAAVYSALKLTTSSPLHTTHSVYIRTRYLPDVQDPTLTFEVLEAVALRPAEIQTRFKGMLGPEFVEKLSQEGINKSWGPPGVETDVFRTVVVWQTQTVHGVTERLCMIPMFLPVRREHKERKMWNSMQDPNFEENLKVSGKVDPASGSRLSPRDVARLQREY